MVFNVSIFLLVALLFYVKYLNHKEHNKCMSLLTESQDRHAIAMAMFAQSTLELMKASNLEEKQKTDSRKEVDNIQIGQLRDMVAKQATMIEKKGPVAQRTLPETMRLADGTEIKTDEYDILI